MLDLRERVLLVLRLVVHRACASLCRARRRAAPCRATRPSRLPPPADRRRTSGPSRDHHREVRGNHSRRAQAGHRPQRRGDDRHHGEVLDRQLPAGDEWHVRVAHRLEGLDPAAAAGAVDQAHERQAQLVRHLLRIDHLRHDSRVGGAAPHREVVSLYHCRSAVDRPRPTTTFAGRSPVSSSPSYSALPASAPDSWNVPGSNSRSIRSRTVSRPAVLRSTRSAPPICRASSSRRRSSSSSGSQLIGGAYSGTTRGTGCG